MCVIEVAEDGLVLTTLRTTEEMRQLDEIGHPNLPKPNARMLEIAEKIVALQSGGFDPPISPIAMKMRRARGRKAA